jgi:quercetin dioxygenase-like cupin family protein
MHLKCLIMKLMHVMLSMPSINFRRNQGSFETGVTRPMHSHPHEQVGMVYNGKASLYIGDEERIVQKGDFYCIPANVPHSDTCISDEPFVMLDIFYPVREDFIEKLK